MISRRATLVAALTGALPGLPEGGRAAASPGDLQADAASLLYRSGFADAPTRDVQDKLRDTVSVRTFTSRTITP